MNASAWLLQTIRDCTAAAKASKAKAKGTKAIGKTHLPVDGGDAAAAAATRGMSVKPGNMLPFEPARAFVRTQKLVGWKGWQVWSKSGKRPSNIPSNPNRVYHDMFVSWPDFLGYERKRGSFGVVVATKKKTTTTKQQKQQQKKSQKRTLGPTSPPPPQPQGGAGTGLNRGSQSRKRAKMAGGDGDINNDIDCGGGAREEDDSGREESNERLKGEDSRRGEKKGGCGEAVKVVANLELEVEEVGGFSIVSAASTLEHTEGSCVMLQGPPTS